MGSIRGFDVARSQSARRPFHPSLIVLIVSLVCLLLSESTFAEALPPRLQVEGSADLAAEVERLRSLDPSRLVSSMELLGMEDPGPPIRVILRSEQSQAAQNSESWIAGYAYGALSTIVLFPERTPSYPDSSLEELLRHEVAHILISRLASHQPLPRWFNEGMAMIAGGSWSLSDRSRVSIGLIAERKVPFDQLDRNFRRGRRAAAYSYAISEAFARYLMDRYGRKVGGDILAMVALRIPFEDAFRQVTGETLEVAENKFWRRQSFWYRWVPIISSSATLWLVITALALVAMARRRQKDAALRRKWEEEERFLASDDPDPQEESGPI